MRVTFDRSANVAYTYPRDIEQGGVAKTVIVDEAPIQPDFDRRGRLIGIEVLSASRHLPDELLKGAERI